MTYQQETDATKLGAVAKYLAIPVPSSEICQINAFGAALTLVDQWRYSNNDDPNEDNATSQWHENNYPFWIAGYILEATETMKMAIVNETKAAGQNGGTFTAGLWVQRNLNTLLSPDNIVTLSSNNITILETGKYLIRALVPASGVNYHQSRLTKNGAELAVGTAGLVGQIAANAHSHVFFCGFLNAGDVIRLEHRASATYITYGLGAGIDATWGNLVFSVMEIIQYS